MKIDDTHNAEIIKYATDLKLVSYEVDGDTVVITRTSMCQTFGTGCGSESDAYDYVIRKLAGEFPEHRVMWNGRTDEWLAVALYKRVA